MNDVDALLVTYDPEHEILLVGRKRLNQSVEILNAFQGEDARYIYKRLLLKKEGTNNG